MNTVKLYRFRGAEVDILKVPAATGKDRDGRPVGGAPAAAIQATARRQGFRFRKELTPAEWRQLTAMRAAGAERAPIPGVKS